jgi:putative PIN family toxin of toxin-antitoxin system
VISHPEITWVASQEIVEEYLGVLRRPRFGLPGDILRKWANVLASFVTVVEVTEVPDFPRDQKDAKFLACVAATDAAYLITGDQDFTEAQEVAQAKVVSVAQFKQLVCTTDSQAGEKDQPSSPPNGPALS